MTEINTYDALAYGKIPRMNDVVSIDTDAPNVAHIDIMLPNGFNSAWKALRLHRIDTRSLVVSDLSSLSTEHELDFPVSDTDFPSMVVDLFPDEEMVFGRNHNPEHLPILDTVVISRRHFALRPAIGEAGLMLALYDLQSHNGSILRKNPQSEPHNESLFADSVT